ncbi:cation:proton antiporter [bacterium]|nr:cation:proton antiporter [bacterium]
MGIAEDIVIIAVASLVCGIVAQKLRLPIMLGYIIAGMIVGPYTDGPSITHIHDVETLADIGIALLLFTVGLEFPLEKLSAVKKIALLGTPLQMLLCIGFGLIVGQCFDWNFVSSLWFGCLISVSSTMVVLRVLSDRGLNGTLSSQVMTAILIMQDLLVIPMMIILPQLQNLHGQLTQMLINLSGSLLWVAFLFIIGSRWLPSILTRVAASRSQELFMVTVLAMGLGMGYITYLNGLSFAFGAFLAGIILSRTDYSHEVMSVITPLRDLFSLLFFASVGVMIEPGFIASHWIMLLTLLMVVFLGKALIMGLTTRLFGYVNIMPLAVGLYMFPIGEFAFVLARLGKSSNGLNNELYMTIVTIAAVSMTLTPLVSELISPIYSFWRKYFPHATSTVVNKMPVSRVMKHHIIIIGYGRVGRSICTAIKGRNSNIIVIEQHPSRITQAKQDGFNVIGGNAASDTILQAANIPVARCIMLTIPDRSNSNYILRKIRRNYPKITICARATSMEHLRELRFYGVSSAVVPEEEASLSMIREAMLLSNYSKDIADKVVSYLRSQNYEPLIEPHEELIVNENNDIQIRNNQTNEAITVYTDDIAEAPPESADKSSDKPEDKDSEKSSDKPADKASDKETNSDAPKGV